LKYDVIVIGAGVGGLTAAAKLASSGKKTMVIEKIHHIGGTSHIFRRGGFIFPMGPLSFSYPDLVSKILKDIGITQNISYKRSHFQLISPNIDIIYSKPLEDLENSLIKIFPNEKGGVSKFFNKLNEIIDIVDNIYEWNPDYLIGEKRLEAEKKLIEQNKKKYELTKDFSKVSSKEFLDNYIDNSDLKKLLGSQGTYEPVMSMLHLAFMWNVMSEKGIWFPSCGIHGINELLYDRIISESGDVKLNTPIKEIIIENGIAKGITTSGGTTYFSDYIISNADYKTTFLQLVDKIQVPEDFYQKVKNNSFTGSEICVYLGIDPEKIDLTEMRAEHVFYRDQMKPERTISIQDEDLSRFKNKEIEICFWSEKSDNFVPTNKKSILLRVNFSYDIMEKWRTGVKKRKQGYKEHKQKLAEKIIKVVEKVLPGLSESIIEIEIATPLTYRDWGKRFQGSIAGWSRDLTKVEGFNRELLIRTPLKNLLMAGLYASKELFLGGYPISMYTGITAADYILELSR
jgi:prolycopene isomerase